jgi:hypothetical protein
VDRYFAVFQVGGQSAHPCRRVAEATVAASDRQMALSPPSNTAARSSRFCTNVRPRNNFEQNSRLTLSMWWLSHLYVMPLMFMSFL